MNRKPCMLSHLANLKTFIHSFVIPRIKWSGRRFARWRWQLRTRPSWRRKLQNTKNWVCRLSTYVITVALESLSWVISLEFTLSSGLTAFVTAKEKRLDKNGHAKLTQLKEQLEKIIKTKEVSTSFSKLYNLLYLSIKSHPSSPIRFARLGAQNSVKQSGTEAAAQISES